MDSESKGASVLLAELWCHCREYGAGSKGDLGSIYTTWGLPNLLEVIRNLYVFNRLRGHLGGPFIHFSIQKAS